MQQLKLTDIHRIIIHSISYGRLEGFNSTIENIAKKYNLDPENVKVACRELNQSEPDEYWLDDLENPTIIKLWFDVRRNS